MNPLDKRVNYIEKIVPNSLTILFSGTDLIRSGDQYFPFEADKNFYYMTAIDQSNVAFVLIKKEKEIIEKLFIERNDEIMVKWEGAKFTKEEASKISWINEVHYLEEFENFIEDYLKISNIKTIYLDFKEKKKPGYTTMAYDFQREFVLKHKDSDIQIKDCMPIFQHIRMVKASDEIEHIKESIEHTRLGIEFMMANCKKDMYEYQLASFFDFSIIYNGNKKVAFPSVVAGGKNATVLHYSKKDAILNKKDLVLVDVGCQTNYYCSDITRTFPVSGRFTKRQRDIYEEVLLVNNMCIASAIKGTTLTELNNYATELLIRACYRLKLIAKDEEIRKYYWHNVSHFLGLDTHDVGFKDMPLQPGHVITIEPGLYIEEENIGIRIEDNILITEAAPINLSANIIKEPIDIIKYMRSNKDRLI
ncbi:MAG: aminopeptidase P family protein [Bacilli bacterium]|jgi:Xaa-Pro aminopeptidase